MEKEEEDNSGVRRPKTLRDRINDIRTLKNEADRILAAMSKLKDSGEPPNSEAMKAQTDALVDVVIRRVDVEEDVHSAVQLKGVIDSLGEADLKEEVDKLFSKFRKAAAEEDADPGNHDIEKAMNFAYDLGYPWTDLDEILPRPLTTVGSVPNRIGELVEEARMCLATGQGNAVVALGRMVLEFAMNDIGERIGRFSQRKNLEDSYRDYPPSQRADDLFGGRGSPRRNRFRDLYNQGSNAIHSNEGAQWIDPFCYFEDVIKFVSDEYAIHLRE